MSWFPVLVYVGIAAWYIGSSYDLFSLTEASKRVAHECIAQDHRSPAFDQGRRAPCFDANLSRPAPVQQANFVDLWRAQGQGPLHGNDIRRKQ